MKPTHQVMRETAADIFSHIDSMAADFNPMPKIKEAARSKEREDKLWKAMTESPEEIAKPLIAYLSNESGHKAGESSPCPLCQFIDKRNKKNG